MNKESETKTVYGVIGSGWRSEFYLRVAQALPERFGVTGLVTRSEETGKKIERKFGVKTFRSAAEMLGGTAPDFAVVSVPGEATPGVIEELAGLGVPVLTETPPATDPEGLCRLAALAEKGRRFRWRSSTSSSRSTPPVSRSRPPADWDNLPTRRFRFPRGTME